jgi:hypothetical protein
MKRDFFCRFRAGKYPGHIRQKNSVSDQFDRYSKAVITASIQMIFVFIACSDLGHPKAWKRMFKGMELAGCSRIE